MTPIGAPDLLALAARHYQAGDTESAEGVCRRIISEQPRHFDALHLLGVVLTHQGTADEAAVVLRRALAEQPFNGLVRLNLGNALLAAKQYQEALNVSDDPQPQTLNNRGLALRGLGRHEEAAAAFRQAIDQQPDYAPAWYNLATSLAKLDRLEAGLEAARTALRVSPPDTPVSRLGDVVNEIGRILMALGRHEEAARTCEVFLRRHPDAQAVAWNLSLALLLMGRFEAGWRLYEHRFGLLGHDERPARSEVLDPERVAGRQVLILTEQGRGDMLQFVRYAPLLVRRGASVTVQAYPDLVPLLAAMPGLASVVSTEAAEPEADFRSPVMSLPLAFRTDLSNVPASVPYLTIPPDREALWAARLGPRRKLRVGLAWSGSVHGAERAAMPARLLLDLMRVPEIEYHCLQRDIFEGDAAWLRQAGPPVTLHQEQLRDFADTAALIGQMDLVVSIDTAVAHLAGVLAKPVWIMLPFTPDWRWLLHRDDSPWYPTVRLFRQPARGAWEPVVQAVVQAIASITGATFS